MKLLRYGLKGQEKPGLLHNGRVRDLSAHVKDIGGSALSQHGLADIAAIDSESLPLVQGIPQKDLRLGPCVAGTTKMIGIGLNYSDHAKEVGMPIPQEPVVFNKWVSCISGPDDDVVLPPHSLKTDWEAEMAIVIGQEATYVPQHQALEYVAGFCIVNDISEREYQNERGGSWDKGKGFNTFGPTGPWLVTKDEVGDFDNLDIWLDVDNHQRQTGNTTTMIFKVPEIVAYCSC